MIKVSIAGLWAVTTVSWTGFQSALEPAHPVNNQSLY